MNLFFIGFIMVDHHFMQPFYGIFMNIKPFSILWKTNLHKEGEGWGERREKREGSEVIFSSVIWSNIENCFLVIHINISKKYLQMSIFFWKNFLRFRTCTIEVKMQIPIDRIFNNATLLLVFSLITLIFSSQQHNIQSNVMISQNQARCVISAEKKGKAIRVPLQGSALAVLFNLSAILISNSPQGKDSG